mgnify:FL=1
MQMEFRHDERVWVRDMPIGALSETVTIDREDGLACDTYRLMLPPPYYVYVQTSPLGHAAAPTRVEDTESSEQDLLPDHGPAGQPRLPIEETDADAPGARP